MIKISRQSPLSVRLPKMSCVPSAEDLQFLLSRAQRNWRVPVELSFVSADSSHAWAIVVQCEMDTGMPYWALFSEDDTDSLLIWTHATAEVYLVQGLIEETCLIRDAQVNVDGQSLPVSHAYETKSEDYQIDVSSIKSLIEPVNSGTLIIDDEAVESVLNALSCPETGVFTLAAMKFFIRQEFNRFQRGGLPFSIVIVELNVKRDGVLRALHLSGLLKAASLILAIKRNIDMLGRFDEDSFCCLLPHTEVAGASIFARRMERALGTASLSPELKSGDLCLFFGVKSIPEDAAEPTDLLLQAYETKEKLKGLS